MFRMTTQQATSPQESPVTVVGLGPMGIALAEALQKKGHPITVWNRTASRADELVAKGATRAETVAEAVSASPVAIMCLKDYETMYDVFGPATEELRGRALVNLNSGTPKEAHAAVAWAGEHGIGYLDGAIMVPPYLIGNPESVFLFSGSEEIFTEHRATLSAMGDPRFLGADASLAVLYNTALLGQMYATMNGFLHATALVASAGVSAEAFADLSVNWFLPTVVTSTLVAQSPAMDKADYPGEYGTMEMNLNALEHITRTCQEQGVHAQQPELMLNIAKEAIARGYGDKNYFAVFEVFKKALQAS
ncbi:NAD(P)-dependent oxidoreductase [Streptomyces amakusaensis]